MKGGFGLVRFFFFFFFSFFFAFFPVGSDLRDLRYLSGMKEGITPRRGEREREREKRPTERGEKGKRIEIGGKAGSG
jgi:hypothetical protein